MPLLKKDGFYRSGHRLYAIWNAMHASCYNPNGPIYRKVGELGIRVCERWHDFDNFVDDVGTRPKSAKGSLIFSRRNLRMDFQPGNVFWESRGSYIKRHEERYQNAIQSTHADSGASA